MTVTNKSDAPSILSKTFQIQGDINSSGILEIEGRVKGSIKGNSVVIREGGFVEGKIDSESLSINGSFGGDIRANNINIFKKAKIIGNIEYKSLSVEDGASIDGQFKKITSDIVTSKTASVDNTPLAKAKVA